MSVIVASRNQHFRANINSLIFPEMTSKGCMKIPPASVQICTGVQRAGDPVLLRKTSARGRETGTASARYRDPGQQPRLPLTAGLAYRRSEMHYFSMTAPVDRTRSSTTVAVIQ